MLCSRLLGFGSHLMFCVPQVEQNVRPSYLQGQEVTGNMRAILIDWLVQVSLKFRLLQETMYMTVGIIDRFLQVCEPDFDRLLRFMKCNTLRQILGFKLMSPNFIKFDSTSIRTTQSPRSSCSWSASLPCSLLPNTRRCTPLRSRILLM